MKFEGLGDGDDVAGRNHRGEGGGKSRNRRKIGIDAKEKIKAIYNVSSHGIVYRRYY